MGMRRERVGMRNEEMRDGNERERERESGGERDWNEDREIERGTARWE